MSILIIIGIRHFGMALIGAHQFSRTFEILYFYSICHLLTIILLEIEFFIYIIMREFKLKYVL